MKITIKQFKKIIREELEGSRAILREAEESGGETQASDVLLLSDDSLDTKVDDYLIKFENETTMDQTSEGLTLRSLLEAPEDEEDASIGAAAEEEEEDPSPESDEKSDNSVEQSINKNLNVRGFAKHVARMVENYTNLFDVKGILLRRSLNYVKSGYGEMQATQLEETLEREFKLSLEKKDLDHDVTVPNAVGAGPGLGA